MVQGFQPKNIIVIGGEGFLGHNLILGLLKHYPQSKIISLDLVQRHFLEPNSQAQNSQDDRSSQDHFNRYEFIKSNLTSIDSLLLAFDRARAELVFHTASPWTGSSQEVCQNVNVKGTINVIKASQKFKVQRLVYTSSAGVVFNGKDLINVDERLPIPKDGCDHYNISKAQAEATVLEANGKESLLTCAIRPAGIFGPGDRQAIPGLIQVLKDRRNGIQIGDNKNLFDWTCVDNVVHAHILASEKLDRVIPLTEFSKTLPPISKTIGTRNLLTSSSNLCGSKSEEDGSSSGAGTDDVELIDLSSSSKANSHSDTSEKNALNPTSWINGNEELIDAPLPAKRHRWDQWAPISTQINYPDDTISVAGEAFFVTNGEPIFFWDFARAVWQEYANHSPLAKRLNMNPRPKRTIVIPASFAFLLALLAQLWSRISRKPTLFTIDKVRYTCASKYHNIEKARVVLGYEPIVSLEEGIQKAVKWYIMNESDEDHHSKETDKKLD